MPRLAMLILLSHELPGNDNRVHRRELKQSRSNTYNATDSVIFIGKEMTGTIRFKFQLQKCGAVKDLKCSENISR